MKSLDEDRGDFITPDDPEYLLENELEGYKVDYICDNCDYKWSEVKKPYFSDEDRTGTRIIIDDSSVVCPMCGSREVSRVK